jgi:hypothetical protein
VLLWGRHWEIAFTAVLNRDWTATEFKVMESWKCGYTGLALISAGNGKVPSRQKDVCVMVQTGEERSGIA